MGVFSLPVLHSSGFIRVGTGYTGDPKTTQHRPPRIKLPAWEKGLSNHFAYNAALGPPQAAEFAFVCVCALYI